MRMFITVVAACACLAVAGCGGHHKKPPKHGHAELVSPLPGSDVGVRLVAANKHHAVAWKTRTV